MAPDKASAKFCTALRGRGFPARSFSHGSRSTFPEERCRLVSHETLLSKNSLRTHTWNRYVHVQSFKRADSYTQDSKLMPHRFFQSCIFYAKRSGYSDNTYEFLFNPLQARISISRSLTATAPGDTDIQLDDAKSHTAESQSANYERKAALARATFKEDNGKNKEDASKQAACEETLKSFEVLLDRMEASSGGRSDQRLGATCLRLAQLSDSAGMEPERILNYGQRALRVYKSAKLSWEHVACLHVIGHAYFRMGDFENAVVHLEQSASLQKKVKPNVTEKDVNILLQARQSLLGQAKMSLGKFQQAIPHFQKSLKLAEKIMEPGSPDLGVAYLQAAQAHKEAKNPHEAICLCIKAVDNHANYYGPKSSPAADIRRFTSIVYFDLKEFENALSEYEIIRPLYEGFGNLEVVAALDLAAVESLLELERFDEAISKLNDIVDTAPLTSPSHANALVVLGKVKAIMKDHESATNFCQMALNLLKKREASTDTGSSLVNLALVFQRLQKIDLAASTYKMALEMYSKFSSFEACSAAADIEGQIGFLLLHLEKVEEALPFLERSVSKKKAIHGASSVELLDVHNHLGVAYSEEGKLDEALTQFEAARTILSNNVTEVDSLSISIYSNLANMYSVFGRLEEAIECQKYVVVSIRRNADVDTMVSLDEAKRVLEDLQRELDSQKNESAKAQKK